MRRPDCQDIGGLIPRTWAEMTRSASACRCPLRLRSSGKGLRRPSRRALRADPLGTFVGRPSDGSMPSAQIEFVYLRWILAGQAHNLPIGGDIPPEQIYGKMPGWPDDFFEFLAAIVQTNKSFAWRRGPHGYLVLCQA
jgi:hypothetical protein